MDLVHGPCHRAVEVGINIVEIFHKANLIAISTEQGRKLFVIHAAENSALADLEAIEMKDRKDGTGLFWVDVLDAVPRAKQ